MPNDRLESRIMNHQPPTAAPTSDELADGAVRLLAEAHAALSSDHFAISDTAPDMVYRYYHAAAVRHCCLLLTEIEQSAAARQEMTVRILGRVFIEAWLTSLYLHFGGHDALLRLEQDTVHQVELTDRDLKDFDARLARAKEKAAAKADKVSKANTGITGWNAANPDLPGKPLIPEPRIPQLTPTGIDISKRLTEDLAGITARSLPLTEIIDRLTELGPEKGFAQETFRPVYILYRMLSAGAVHANINVYDAYYQPGPPDMAAPIPVNGESLIMNTRITALYSTAFLLGWVCLGAGITAPVAVELRKRLEPDPTSHVGWAPGTPPPG